MSWFSIPLPNPFKSLQFSDDEKEGEEEDPQNDAVSVAAGGGVKDDLSAIGETIGRQLRAFISPETSNSGDGESSSSRTFEGIRSDLEEIKGTFKSSLSLLSSNRAVSEISKLASNFLQIDEENDVDFVNRNRKINDGHDVEDEVEDDDDDGVGINDEVIQFAHQISDRPELWTDFPLSFDHEFDISEVQYEHASIVEQMVPSLADLRSRVTNHMSEKQFWMIYFILLLPRLNEEDSEILSTPETVDARETLLKMLRAKKNEEISSENPQLDGPSDSDSEVQDTSVTNSQSVETKTSENLNASRSVKSNESNQSDGKPEGLLTEKREKHDNWGEEKAVTTRTSAGALKQFQSEDDVSFSDLEDDDNDLPNKEASSRPSQLTRSSSPEGSNEWVQLNNKGSQVKGQSSLRERDSEGEDSTGWLTVDDFDP